MATKHHINLTAKQTRWLRELLPESDSVSVTLAHHVSGALLTVSDWPLGVDEPERKHYVLTNAGHWEADKDGRPL